MGTTLHVAQMTHGHPARKPRGRRRSVKNPWGSFTAGAISTEVHTMLTLMDRTGAPIEDIRNLIGVTDEVENSLRAYARENAAEPWVERALMFRKRVAEEFERLACPVQRSSTEVDKSC